MAFPAIGFRGALDTIRRRMMADPMAPRAALAELVTSGS
jgi:hypothetical protein